MASTGRRKSDPFCSEAVEDIISGVISWLAGCTFCEVEKKLGGNPNSKSQTQQVCPRARELVTSVIPRGLSFIMGLITRIIEELNPYDAQDDLTKNVVENLSAAVRLGYDTPEKLLFSFKNRNLRSRVAVHKYYNIINEIE